MASWGAKLARNRSNLEYGGKVGGRGYVYGDGSGDGGGSNSWGGWGSGMAALLRSFGSASVLGAGIGAVVGLIAPYGYSYGLEYHFGVSLDLKRWVSFSRSYNNGGIEGLIRCTHCCCNYNCCFAKINDYIHCPGMKNTIVNRWILQFRIGADRRPCWRLHRAVASAGCRGHFWSPMATHRSLHCSRLCALCLRVPPRWRARKCLHQRSHHRT